jgi:hypothetical protein
MESMRRARSWLLVLALPGMGALVAASAARALGACSGDELVAPTDPAAAYGAAPRDPSVAPDAGGYTGIADAGDQADAGDAAPTFVFEHRDLNHVLSTGQSLSVGAVGTPVLSTTQPFDNRMFVTGAIAGGTGLTSLVPLVETGVETMSSALANLVTDMAEKQVFLGLPQPLSTHRLLVSCHGIGGTAYVGLKKGTTAYANGIAQATAGRDLAKAAGLTYAVRALTNVHGESDHVAGNAAYEQDLVTWQRDYETDVTAITGQTLPIPMLHTQMSSWTKYGQATSRIPGAQLDAHVDNPGKILLVGAKYHLEYAADGVHLTSAGYRHMGEYHAKVYRHVVLEGKVWEPVRPKSAAIAGDEIRVVFHVPVPPLAFDTSLVPAALNQGFEYADDAAQRPAITSVTLDGPMAVKIKLASVPTGANKRIRYAFTGTVNAAAGGATGPRGNLRDSDATPSRVGRALYNWAVHFDQKM